jgi:hypothetical protein
MRSNAGYGPGRGLALRPISLSEEMTAFDQLPPEIRAAFNYFPVRAISAQGLDWLRAGKTVREILTELEKSKARFGLSFVKEE